MTTATSTNIRKLSQDDGQWLYRLLTDVRKDVSAGPSAQAIERMRARLDTEIATPVRAAA